MGGFPPQERKDIIIVNRKEIVSKLEELGGGEVGFTLFKKNNMTQLYNGKVVVEFKEKKFADNCIEKYRQSANFYHQVKQERKREEEFPNKNTADEDTEKEAYRLVQEKILAVEDWKTLPIIEVAGPEGQKYRIMIKPFDVSHPYHDKPPRGEFNRKRKFERSVSGEEDE